MKVILTFAALITAHFAFSQGSIDIDTNIQMGVVGTEHVKITSNAFSVHNGAGGTPLIYGDFASGKVGIGTTSPGQKLDINGSLALNGSLIVDGKTTIRDRFDISTTVSYSSGSWFDIPNSLSTGSYVCYVNRFKSAGYGGGIWHYSATFLMSWYSSTNSSDSFTITPSASAHAMNGRSVSFRIKNVGGHNSPKFQMKISGESVNNVPLKINCMRVF